MKNERINKAKAWFKKHWWKVALTIAGVAVVIIFKGDKKVELKLDEMSDKDYSKFVDEDIFTDLAIKIEEAVLNPEVKDISINRAYDGLNIHKIVSVRIFEG